MKRVMVAVLFILAAGGAARAAETLQLQDFARMMPLTLSAQGALHELSLPAEVYARTERRDLGDLAVFNGQGEIVPFTLVTPSPVRAAPTGKELPVFPLTGGVRRPQGGIAMQVRTDEHGAIVNLNTGPGRTSSAPVTTYIVDASSQDISVTGFDFVLTPGANEYIGTLRVEASDDLQQWREHASGALAILSAGERRLTRDRVEFPAVKARYFRLSICPEQGVPHIDAVTARLESPLADQVRATASYSITPIRGNSGEYLVQTGGHMPVDSLRLVFPEENSLAGVTFLSRPDDKSPWIERGSGTFYRLRRGATAMESRALEIAPIPDREWLIRIRQPGGGLGSKLPQLEVGWRPHRLIFAARGEPPFCLAYGSARTGGGTLRDDGIAAGLAAWEEQQIKPSPAQAGPSEEAGGRQALRPRIPATTWKKVLLWGVLTLGVALLGWMAIRLWREMETTDGKE